jgi:hypothetical protein
MVHLFFFGTTACGLQRSELSQFPEDKTETLYTLHNVDCSACLEAYKEACDDASKEEVERRSRPRRLPHGGETRNVYVYLNAWAALVEPLLDIFEGYVVTAFDPDIAIDKYEDNALGQTVVTDRVVLSTKAASLLIAKFKSKTDT